MNELQKSLISFGAIIIIGILIYFGSIWYLKSYKKMKDNKMLTMNLVIKYKLFLEYLSYQDKNKQNYYLFLIKINNLGVLENTYSDYVVKNYLTKIVKELSIYLPFGGKIAQTTQRDTFIIYYPTIDDDPYLLGKQLKLFAQKSYHENGIHITKTNSIDPLYPALLVFNAMFGGTFQSDLIRVVREENSLAYTIVSQMIPDLKLLFVSAGIDSNNYKLTKELVEKELVNYQNGKLNLDNMRLAKDSLINELIEIEDSPNGIINFYFRNKIYNQAETLESLLEKITNVTEEQIVEVAKGITLDTIFLLAGDNYEG